MGKMKELLIDTETSGLDGKPVISITELPHIMAQHRMKQGLPIIMDYTGMFMRAPKRDLLEEILQTMSLAVIRDQFRQAVAHSKPIRTPTFDVQGTKYIDPKTWKDKKK